MRLGIDQTLVGARHQAQQLPTVSWGSSSTKARGGLIPSRADAPYDSGSSVPGRRGGGDFVAHVPKLVDRGFGMLADRGPSLVPLPIDEDSSTIVSHPLRQSRNSFSRSRNRRNSSTLYCRPESPPAHGEVDLEQPRWR